MTRKPWFILFGLMALTLAMGLAACGDDDDDAVGDDDDGGDLTAEQQAAADYISDLAETYNSEDYEAFVAEFTDKGLAEFAQDDETPPAELREAAPDFLEGGDPVENIEFEEVEVAGDVSTLTITSESGREVQREIFTLTKEADDYQVDGYVRGVADIPEGVTPLAVSGVEFAYIFEGGDAEAGVQAIAFTNEGEQFHQIVLLKTAADAAELDSIVDDALNAEGPDDLPPSIEEVVVETAAAPGDSADVVFTDALEAGRYVMICFIPDETQGEEGPPHATLGMAAEFTIE